MLEEALEQVWEVGGGGGVGRGVLKLQVAKVSFLLRTKLPFLSPS